MEGVEWKREEEIGAGGFGRVYRAIATTGPVNKSTIPSLLAVKSVKITQSSTLLEEAAVLSFLPASPYIIGYYGHDPSVERSPGKPPQYFYNLFLEYASHGSLKNMIRQSSHGLPESLVKSYTRNIVKGLDHIHKHGYVHCDIKPDNILLAADKDVIVPKIADFGLAKLAGDQVNGLRGTPHYMAPESIRWKEFEPRCDVWALGCVVLEMLTGKRAWHLNKGEPVSSLLDRIANSKELPNIPKTLSPEAADFIRNCLVKDPALRWNPDVLLHHPFVCGEGICLKAGSDQVLSSSPNHPFGFPSVETDDRFTSCLSQFPENLTSLQQNAISTINFLPTHINCW